MRAQGHQGTKGRRDLGEGAPRGRWGEHAPGTGLGPGRRGLAALVALLLAGGCAFAEGDPWGRAELDLRVRFDPSPRLDDQERVRTPQDYAVAVEHVELVVDSATLTVVRGASGGVTAFDPANPPEGFSLCHQGHCHADDGSLWDYEDIERLLADGAGGEGDPDAVVQVFLAQPVRARAEGAPVPTGACSGDCFLDRGEVTTVVVRVTELAFQGRVFDRLTGEARRLPAEGVGVWARLPVSIEVEALVAAEIGPDQPIGLGLDIHLVIPHQLFDGIDWVAQLPEDGGGALVELNDVPPLAEAIVENVTNEAWLDLEIQRF